MKAVKTIGFATTLLLVYLVLFSAPLEVGDPDFNTALLLFGTGLGLHAAITFHESGEKRLYIVFTLIAVGFIPLTIKLFPSESALQMKVIAWLEGLSLLLTRLVVNIHFRRLERKQNSPISSARAAGSASMS